MLTTFVLFCLDFVVVVVEFVSSLFAKEIQFPGTVTYTVPYSRGVLSVGIPNSAHFMQWKRDTYAPHTHVTRSAPTKLLALACGTSRFPLLALKETNKQKIKYNSRTMVRQHLSRQMSQTYIERSNQIPQWIA